MGSLFSSLLNTAGALHVYERQFATIQNNVANVNTPGYARTMQSLEALRMDLEHGLPGGVAAGPLISSRSEYSESAVRDQFSRLGLAEQKAGDLARVEPLFNLTTDSGVAGSLTSFFNSFSRLSINPNDSAGRQSVLDSAQAVSGAFRGLASGLVTAGKQADSQIHYLADTVNHLAVQLRDINAMYLKSSESTADPALDAPVHAILEQLSEVADFSVTHEADGTYSVHLSGGTPLVIGERHFQISVDSSSPQTAILDTWGKDISTQLHYGKLAGALEEKNRLIPSYRADLDTLAKSLADQVNQQLASGLDANGRAPALNLFSYDPVAGAAASLGITAITPDQIAAAAPNAPGGNANALNLAGMASAALVNGTTFTGYFGQLGARVGRDLADAKADQQTRKDMLDQARSLREQISGVSLDEEATHLLQVQRAYQASGKLMTVVNDMLDTLMQMVR